MNLAKRFYLDRDVKYVAAQIAVMESDLPEKLDRINKINKKLKNMHKWNPLRLYYNRDLVEITAWVTLTRQELPKLKQRLEELKNIK